MKEGFLSLKTEVADSTTDVINESRICSSLSDIHFGQEKGGDLYINNDVKERLIDDVRELVADLPSGRAAGLIVTGDIAYAGKEDEYTEAGLWLDRVAQAAGCKKTDIQLVPGNHDIDRDEITKATELMLQNITTEGQQALDGFLKSPVDTALLYRRFLFLYQI